MENPQSAKANCAQEIKAAAYVRMSTDRQTCSIGHQIALLEAYADEMNMQICEVFADEGKSGLTYDKRPALRRLIESVQSKIANFSSILVLDVSRWGRFQDVDESAHYEYVCRQAGITIHYVAEPFPNDGSSLSSLLKAVKRTMAAEYSRELSSKVFAAKCRYSAMGFHQGGRAGYGLRRAVVDMDRNIKKSLLPHERKTVLSDRIILIPGPKHEIKIVNWIFRRFVYDKLGETQIANLLNAKGIKTDLGKSWKQYSVSNILCNEKYIGHKVANKSSIKFGIKHVNNSQDQWIRKENAYEAIVDQTLFAKAQTRIQSRQRGYTDKELLRLLKKLLKQEGRLTADIIDAKPGFPSATTYVERFGRLARAYELIHYQPGRQYVFYKHKQHFAESINSIESHLINRMETLGVEMHRMDSEFRLWCVDNTTILAPVMGRSVQVQRKTGNCIDRKAAFGDRVECSDLGLFICMDDRNISPVSYYLLPSEIAPRSFYFPRKSLRYIPYMHTSLEEVALTLKNAITNGLYAVKTYTS